MNDSAFDWGSVLQGEVVIHEFEIKNSGGAPLKIERVKPSCGCTTVDFDKVIAPGATGKVTLKVDTKKFSGRIKKTAKVITNTNKAVGEMILTMEGEIEVAVAQGVGRLADAPTLVHQGLLEALIDAPHGIVISQVPLPEDAGTVSSL